MALPLTRCDCVIRNVIKLKCSETLRNVFQALSSHVFTRRTFVGKRKSRKISLSLAIDLDLSTQRDTTHTFTSLRAYFCLPYLLNQFVNSRDFLPHDPRPKSLDHHFSLFPHLTLFSRKRPIQYCT